MQEFRERVRDNPVIHSISEKALLRFTREVGPSLQRRMPQQRGHLIIIHYFRSSLGGAYRGFAFRSL